MSKIVNVQFRNLGKYPVKIYNNGRVILQNVENTQIIRKCPKKTEAFPRIKSAKGPQKSKIALNFEGKNRKISLFIPYKSGGDEEDSGRKVGNLLKKAFSEKELECKEEISPNPKVNYRKKKGKVKEVKKKIKPYIQETDMIEPKTVNAGYLQRTIKLINDNNNLVLKVNFIAKNSKNLNKGNKTKFLEGKLSPDDNGNKCRNDIKSKGENNKESEVNFGKETNEKLNFIGITDISKEKKYIDARNLIEKSKENCTNMAEFIMSVDQKLKENSGFCPNNKEKEGEKVCKNNTDHKQSVDLESKMKELVLEVKGKVGKEEFDLGKLSAKDRKLLIGSRRYDPNKRKKHIFKSDVNDPKDLELLKKSQESLFNLTKLNKGYKAAIKSKSELNSKKAAVNSDIAANFCCVEHLLNSVKICEKIDLQKVKDEKEIEIDDENDLFNYMYLTEDYVENWYSDICVDRGKGREKGRNEYIYKHPFLMYED